MFYLLFLFCLSLNAREITLERGLTIPIHLEHAVTEEQVAWGLMQRRGLPENSGMTFTYEKPNYVHFWTFNCLIDLSVAYLDERKIIKEIYSLQAYPEKMDPLRPMRSVADFQNYSPTEPIISFFLTRGARSSFPTKYALEMNLNWFKNNDIKVGDAVWWTNNSPQGFVIRTIDLSPYLPLSEPLVIQFPDAAFRSFKFPNDRRFYEVRFFNNEGRLVGKLAGSHHALAICYEPVSRVEINSLGKNEL